MNRAIMGLLPSPKSWVAQELIRGYREEAQRGPDARAPTRLNKRIYPEHHGEQNRNGGGREGINSAKQRAQ